MTLAPRIQCSCVIAVLHWQQRVGKEVTWRSGVEFGEAVVVGVDAVSIDEKKRELIFLGEPLPGIHGIRDQWKLG